jgi:DNA-binding FadR family transcriptional regulator
MRFAIGDPQALLAETDLNIHVALAETCRNRFLVGECKRLLSTAGDPFWQRARSAAWTHPDLLKEWVGQHERVLRAIESRRPADAEAASRGHLLSVASNALDKSASPLERERLSSIVERFETILGPANLESPGTLVHDFS